MNGTVCAGFPSPADDYFQSRIDLNEELIRNPDATFGIWVQGNSMQDDGIESGDFLLVDRSISPSDKALAICVLNNEFTIKRLEKRGNRIRLLPANAAFPPIVVQEGDELIRLTRRTVCHSRDDEMHYWIIKMYINHRNAV